MGTMQLVNFKTTQTPPGTLVTVKAKPWYQSKMVIFNGVLFVVAAFSQIFDILTGANVLAPLLGVFFKDPAQISHAVQVLTEIYTLINVYLRVFKTAQPVTV